jgi:hypothetical protein
VVRVHGYRSRCPGFDSWYYQIFWDVVGLECGPLILVSTIEELLGRKSSGSGLGNREYGHRDPLCSPGNTIYPQTLALTVPTSGGLSVDIVRSGAQATEFACLFVLLLIASPIYYVYKHSGGNINNGCWIEISGGIRSSRLYFNIILQVRILMNASSSTDFCSFAYSCMRG